MQPVAVAGCRFDGVSEGVAEVEQGALAMFAFIGGDDAGLVLAGLSNGVREGLGVA